MSVISVYLQDTSFLKLGYKAGMNNYIYSEARWFLSDRIKTAIQNVAINYSQWLCIIKFSGFLSSKCSDYSYLGCDTM
jgi:hypothetical protein